MTNEEAVEVLRELEDSKFLEHYGTINRVDMSDYQQALNLAISALQRQERLSMAEFRGVLARGYCTPRNSHKVLDAGLIEDMVVELLAEIKEVR